MQTRSLVLAASALAATVALSACGNPTKTATSSTVSATAVATTTTAGDQAHDNADVQFTQRMIPHHQQAIEMSDAILAKQGIDPRVVALANQIKAAQGPEITQMQGWLTQWGVPAMPMTPGDMGDMPGHDGTTGMPGMPGHDGMPGMDMGSGMMSPADMTALQNAQGVAASKLFLTQMIQHHQGAITMSQQEITSGQYPATVELAKSITGSQQKEIDQMNAILATL
ncbi:DUF305 domain-containing protein [Mycolicibacterium sp. CH28]|uniref:DUF305 domain-containing protein n=1 Tax=Mycolicibacterium sp. CH28 TaxID=2512237 RepID=UPI0010820F04|nr:DUF305 domain-containing protein [Mycolicibacterium sp. CH28]TGD84879.1 DUF305 domain-containing protein [Mycolicibacterium sp. CH28]